MAGVVSVGMEVVKIRNAALKVERRSTRSSGNGALTLCLADRRYCRLPKSELFSHDGGVQTTVG